MNNNGYLFEKIMLKSLRVKGKGFYFWKISTPTAHYINNKINYSNNAKSDFVGVFNGKFIILETKTTIKDKFYFKKIQDHQVKYLQKINNNKGYAFIIIWMQLTNEVYIIDIKYWDNIINKHKSINSNSNIKFVKKISFNKKNLLDIINFLNDYIK